MNDIKPFLQSQIDQGLAALRQLVANNSPDDINRLLARCVEMNNAEDEDTVMWGTFGAFAIASGILAHLEAGGQYE